MKGIKELENSQTHYNFKTYLVEYLWAMIEIKLFITFAIKVL
jgi:hypothetical protein